MMKAVSERSELTDSHVKMRKSMGERSEFIGTKCRPLTIIV